jgi:hypothetical protein
VEKYGEDALIAMGAGFLLGGGIGAVTPRPGLATPEREPRDLLNDPPAEPLALPAPDAPAGLLPPPTPTDPLALPGPPRALLGPSVMVTPPPVQDAAPIVTPPPGAIPMPGMPEGLEGPVALGFQRAAAAGPSYVMPPAPPAPPPPAPPAPVIEQAPVTHQRTDVPPGAARLRQRPSERAETYAPTAQAAPVEPTETALGTQLNALLRQQQERAAVQQVAEAQAAAPEAPTMAPVVEAAPEQGVDRAAV